MKKLLIAIILILALMLSGCSNYYKLKTIKETVENAGNEIIQTCFPNNEGTVFSCYRIGNPVKTDEEEDAYNIIYEMTSYVIDGSDNETLWQIKYLIIICVDLHYTVVDLDQNTDIDDVKVDYVYDCDYLLISQLNLKA